MEGNQGYRNNSNDYYHSSSGTGMGSTQSSLSRNGQDQRSQTDLGYRSAYGSQSMGQTGAGYRGSYGAQGAGQGAYGARQAGSAYSQDTYTRNTGSTNSGNAYSQSAGPVQPRQTVQTAKPKKKGGTFKKVLAGALVGVVFGAFAGAGFFAVSAAGNLVKEKIPALEGTADNNTVPSTQAPADKPGKDPQGPAAPDPQTTAPADSASAKDPSTVSNTEPVRDVVTTTVTDVTEVVKNTMPALVSVNNKYTEKLNYFGQIYYQDAEGAGSGIIVGQNDEELLLVTNFHVVKAAKELTVTFVDNSEAEAELVGKDEDKDLAVISVKVGLISEDTKNAIAVANLGDSNDLTVGEPVIAIGNSLGYGQSVTTGVVSALNRPIAASSADDYGHGDKEIATFIQTDAAINPGNSGGALLNIRGEVIGINSNKVGGTVVEGMGYAIPISSAKPIIEDMINKQSRLRVSDDEKGYLGITGVDVGVEYSEIYGIPIGVYISSVNGGSGADAAGLMKGDIITGLNGEEITCMDDLKNELSYYTAGTTVDLEIMQGTPVGYQAKTVQVVLSAASQ